MLFFIFTVFAAFSFVKSSNGLLEQNMGFLSNSPANVREDYATIMGRDGSLDTKEAVFSLSKHNSFFKVTYKSFGMLEVRGNIPDDENYTPSYPYLFKIEAGGITRLGKNTRLGVSFSFFEQRIMMDDLKGYSLNIGTVYFTKIFSFGGYLRNVGPSVGYYKEEKYSIPIDGAVYGVVKKGKNTASIEISMDDLSIKNAVYYISYTRNIYDKLSLGGEIALEKDLSLGYRTKYPLKAILKYEIGKYEFGFEVNIPKGGFDIKESLYLGVKL